MSDGNLQMIHGLLIVHVASFILKACILMQGMFTKAMYYVSACITPSTVTDMHPPAS